MIEMTVYLEWMLPLIILLGITFSIIADLGDGKKTRGFDTDIWWQRPPAVGTLALICVVIIAMRYAYGPMISSWL